MPQPSAPGIARSRRLWHRRACPICRPRAARTSGPRATRDDMASPAPSAPAAEGTAARPALSAAGLRVALYSGNYNSVRDGANKALNRLVAHLLARGAAVRVYAPLDPHRRFAAPGEIVEIPSRPIPDAARIPRLVRPRPSGARGHRGVSPERDAPVGARPDRMAGAEPRAAARHSGRRQPAHAVSDLFRVLRLRVPARPGRKVPRQVLRPLRPRARSESRRRRRRRPFEPGLRTEVWGPRSRPAVLLARPPGPRVAPQPRLRGRRGGGRLLRPARAREGHPAVRRGDRRTASPRPQGGAAPHRGRARARAAARACSARRSSRGISKAMRCRGPSPRPTSWSTRA